MLISRHKNFQPFPFSIPSLSLNFSMKMTIKTFLVTSVNLEKKILERNLATLLRFRRKESWTNSRSVTFNCKEIWVNQMKSNVRVNFSIFFLSTLFSFISFFSLSGWNNVKNVFPRVSTHESESWKKLCVM